MDVADYNLASQSCGETLLSTGCSGCSDVILTSINQSLQMLQKHTASVQSAGFPGQSFQQRVTHYEISNRVPGQHQTPLPPVTHVESPRTQQLAWPTLACDAKSA